MSYGEISAHSASKDPNKLFLPDPERKVSWLYDKKIPAIGVFFGTVPFMGANYMTRMPWYSGGWRMIIGGTLLGTAGYYYHLWREERMAEYDAMLRWYIAEHPEEFPVPERKKVGELFKEWIPVR